MNTILLIAEVTDSKYLDVESIDDLIDEWDIEEVDGAIQNAKKHMKFTNEEIGDQYFVEVSRDLNKSYNVVISLKY